MPDISDFGIEFEATWVGYAPAGWGEGARQWRVTLRCEGREYSLDYHTGSAIEEATGEDVVGCILSDASGIYSCGTFEEWCANYGYDAIDEETGEENAAHRRLFQACVEQTVAFEALVGGQDRVEELGEAWQDW